MDTEVTQSPSSFPHPDEIWGSFEESDICGNTYNPQHLGLTEVFKLWGTYYFPSTQNTRYILKTQSMNRFIQFSQYLA